MSDRKSAPKVSVFGTVISGTLVYFGTGWIFWLSLVFFVCCVVGIISTIMDVFSPATE